MKRRLAQTIVKYRSWMLVVLFLLAVGCLFTIGKTRINYDLNRYLSDDTMTKRALLVMQDEFGAGEQLRVMFLNKTDGEIASYTDQINALPEVLLASFDPETGLRQSEGDTCHLITVAV